MKHFIYLLTVLSFTLSVSGQNVKFSSATIGALEARSIGPATMSGRITAIEGINKEPRTIYVGTAGGGIWKTTDGCSSFKPVFDKHCQSIGAIAIDQARPDTVWAGTGESNMRNSVSVGNGIYRSADGGENWSKMGLDSTEHISRILIHPSSPNTVFAAVPGHLWDNSKERGLYRTKDGGKTWEKVLYIDDKTGCAEVIMNPANPNIMYATMWEFRRKPFSFNSGGKGSGIYKSTDGGTTWKKLTNGLPEGEFGRVAIALAPSAPDNILAIVESKATGLYISSDGGASWKQQSSSSNVTARPFYFSTLVVDPKDAKRVYRPSFTFSISTDGGYSFSEGGYFNGPHPDHHALWINPAYTNQMYLGSDGGVYVSNDRGNSWVFIQNLPVSQFYHVSTDLQTPYNVYGGLQDNGSWKAPSQSPSGINNKDWDELYGGDGFWVQPDDINQDIVYAEYQGGHMARVNMKTQESLDIQPYPLAGEEKLRWNWNTPIVKSPTQKGVLYTGSQFLYKTENQGTTWKKISPDLTTNDKNKQKQEESGGLTVDNSSAENHCTIFTIAESPLNAQEIWVGTDDGNLQVSRDGGNTWTNLTANYALAGIPKGTWISSIMPGNFDKNTVYVTFDNHTYGDCNTYLARSKDGGKTWERLNSKEFTGFAHKILEDIESPDLLFLGTEMGLFVSIDKGQNWARMKAGFPEYALVRDLVIQPQTHDLVIATHGRGIYILDDISPLRKINNAMLESEVAFIESRPAILKSRGFGGGYPSQPGEFAGPNKSEDARIIYYLKNRITTEEVKMRFYDSKGTFLYEKPASKRKGINVVNWDMRMKPPKAAKTGASLDMGGFISPLLDAGTCKVVLMIGEKSFETQVKLVEDDKSVHSAEDRKAQRNLSLQLYNQVEELAYFTQQIVSLQADLKKGLNTIKDEVSIKPIQAFHDSLESVRKTLVATKEGTAITGEEQIREKLSSLFAQVSFWDGRPTDSHYDRAKALAADILKAKQKVEKLSGENLGKINSVFTASGLPALSLLTKEDFMKD
ncbi:MAG: glycosyl hydrolase [Bacteroidia bacterium]|nr:glycosyl hydrolase [Bacteroidia bacterium]